MNKSRRVRSAGHVARMGERRGACRVLVLNSDGGSQLGRPRRRWEDNIKMDLEEVGWEGMDWINLPQDWDRWRAIVIAIMNHCFHKLWGISGVAQDLLAFEEGLCSMNTVSLM